MKKKINACVWVIGLVTAIVFSNCATTRRYDFSLKNTLSIFLLNNGNDHFFCIPVQYFGDYQIAGFEFDEGNITIGDYEILLKRDEINIYVYLNEATEEDEFGNSDDDFNIIYSEENGRISISKLGEPLTIKQESDGKMNHYYIFIERYLSDNEMKKITNEYKRGNVYSRLSIWYDITIDNEEQGRSGMLDDFELYDGPAIDPASFLPNMNFFSAKYLR